jgi:hypothetical protein
VRSGYYGAAAVLCMVATTFTLVGESRPRLRAGLAVVLAVGAVVLLFATVEVRNGEVARDCADGTLVDTGTLLRCDRS